MQAYIIADKRWNRVDLPEPKPGYGEVLISMRAAALNFRDWLVVMGKYLSPSKPDCIPLSDGAGEIIAVGEGVTQFKVGDRVMANFFETWYAGSILPEYHAYALGGAVDGMLAEKVVRKACSLLKIPAYLTYEEAATLPCAGLTAWNALMESNIPLKTGSTILTLGTGGVSLFAMQFAKAAGLHVISTSSSDAKLAYLRDKGLCDYGINYKTYPEWQHEVNKITDYQGVDHVIEVGGDTMRASLASLKMGGAISIIGFRAGTHHPFNPVDILAKCARLQAVFVGSVAMFTAMNQALVWHELKPLIDEVFDFAHANQALEKFIAGKSFGKVVIRF